MFWHASNAMHMVLAAAVVLAQPASAMQIAQREDTSAKTREYTRLAEQHKPRTQSEQQLVEEYMSLPASQRGAFKSNHPNVSKSIWDYAPYAVCFYASVAGGADVVEAGDECHADWVD